MNKKIIIGIIALALFGVIVVMEENNDQQINTNSAGETANETQTTNIKNSADKIEIMHFHATHQCWSCITVGEYALKTIKEKFPEEYKNGTIVFRDINGELPENKDIVMKYQARGSSLFINTITDGQDSIEEDIKVWRLITNETQFIDYFENKLKNLLGK
ncbi:MAG: nitrophenyl compound nitroreductase subunit ArsF family protein [Minisyncoccales bacterium]